jgi:hypothetical protein
MVLDQAPSSGILFPLQRGIPRDFSADIGNQAAHFDFIAAIAFRQAQLIMTRSGAPVARDRKFAPFSDRSQFLEIPRHREDGTSRICASC